MKPLATYQAANGKNYSLNQALDDTWYWEQGDSDAYGFATLDSAIESAKEHAKHPASQRAEREYGSDERQAHEYYQATRL